jgi:hypothetical protein
LRTRLRLTTRVIDREAGNLPSRNEIAQSRHARVFGELSKCVDRNHIW